MDRRRPDCPNLWDMAGLDPNETTPETNVDEMFTARFHVMESSDVDPETWVTSVLAWSTLRHPEARAALKRGARWVKDGTAIGPDEFQEQIMSPQEQVTTITKAAEDSYEKAVAAGTPVEDAAQKRDQTIADAKSLLQPEPTREPATEGYWTVHGLKWQQRVSTAVGIALAALWFVLAWYASAWGFGNPVGAWLVHHWWASGPVALCLIAGVRFKFVSAIKPAVYEHWNRSHPAGGIFRWIHLYRIDNVDVRGNWPMHLWVALSLVLLLSLQPWYSVSISLALLAVPLLLPKRMRKTLVESLLGSQPATLRQLFTPDKVNDPVMSPSSDRSWAIRPLLAASLPTRTRTGDLADTLTHSRESLLGLADLCHVDQAEHLSDVDSCAGVILADAWTAAYGATDPLQAAEYGTGSTVLAARATCLAASRRHAFPAHTGDTPARPYGVADWWDTERDAYLAFATKWLPAQQAADALQTAADEIAEMRELDIPDAPRKRLETILYALQVATVDALSAAEPSQP